MFKTTKLILLDSLLQEIFYKQWSVNVNHAKDSSKDIKAHMELESVETPHLRIRLPGIMKSAWQKPAKNQEILVPGLCATSVKDGFTLSVLE